MAQLQKLGIIKRPPPLGKTGWEDRLLMFRDGELAYYEKKQTFQWQSSEIKDGTVPFAIKLMQGDKMVWQFACANQKEKDAWLMTLREAQRLDSKRKINPEKAYDIVIDIDSLLDLEQGWDVHFSPTMLERAKVNGSLQDPKQAAAQLSTATSKAIVSVLGLFNKGKTYLLNKLCDEDLASGFKVTTKGLSFKEPESMNNYIMLDTAGTSSPLQVKKSNCTLSVKKSTEDFLQKMSFLLSDVIIVVVNELTWPDQEYISALAMHLEENQKKLPFIIVVHNFKDTETEQDFLDMRQKFCVNCFRGNKKTEKVSGIDEPVEWFESLPLRHVFLARDGTPAGLKFNEGTVSLIKAWLTGASSSKNELPLIPRFCENAQRELNMYFSGVKALHLAHDDARHSREIEKPKSEAAPIANNNLFWKNNSTANFDDEKFTPYKIRATPRDGHKNLGFINNQIFYEGFHMALANTVFQLKYDLVRHKNYLVVIFDCAGIGAEWKKGQPVPEGPWIRARLTSVNNKLQLVVDGNKVLDFADNPEDPNSSYIMYVPVKEGQTVQTRQLPAGEFTQCIDIPVDSRTDVPPKTILNEGKFTVYIEKNDQLSAKMTMSRDYLASLTNEIRQ